MHPAQGEVSAGQRGPLEPRAGSPVGGLFLGQQLDPVGKPLGPAEEAGGQSGEQPGGKPDAREEDPDRGWASPRRGSAPEGSGRDERFPLGQDCIHANLSLKTVSLNPRTLEAKM